MTGTITFILSRAGYHAMNGPLADERRRLAGAEAPAAYVSYDPRLLAGAGWYGYRIALNGGDRQMVERARYMLSERYVIRDGYEYYAGGVYVFGVLLRERVPHYGIGGGAPTPEPDALNFYMPNGGTISLNKIGSPAIVELEYSIDRGATWTIWQEDNDGNRSLTLTAGQRMYVRNTSETSTGFSTSITAGYRFSFSDTAEANGNVNSLICRNTEDAVITPYCFSYLFYNNYYLVTPPEFPSVNIANYCYARTFYNCRNLTKTPTVLPALSAKDHCYYEMFNVCTAITESPLLSATNLNVSSHAYMFYNCVNLVKINTSMTNITPNSCISNWVNGVAATGDFYCPASLTIPTGVSGIPTGWTRHDI